MNARGFILTALAAASSFGCGGSTKNLPVVPEAYPVRADWLVKSVPSAAGQPSKYYESGYPPILMLNRPKSTLTGDDALLASQINRTILDTRQIDADVREEFGNVLTELYGTPGEPKVPSGELLMPALKVADLSDERAKLISVYQDELKLDAATLKEGGIVYRNYCQHCHGLTGDGNGPGGRFLVPMPRDYRQGLFKFITTDPTALLAGAKLESTRKPRRADLYRTIVHGLDGSPMPQFAGLSETELQALISYVIHLSMRGEAEYEAMKKAADPGGDGMAKNEVRKELLKQAAAIVPRWVASARHPIEPAPNPYVGDDQIQKSAENGYRLFTSSGCAACHVNFGRSSPYQFDSWGTMVRPRNLTVAILRGGRSPEDIYARIFGGILGSNMPAHVPTEEDRAKDPNKLWDLVNFVRYVSESEKRQVLKDKFAIEIDE
jgi:mono/diheme cytochrome c family protein